MDKQQVTLSYKRLTVKTSTRHCPLTSMYTRHAHTCKSHRERRGSLMCRAGGCLWYQPLGLSPYSSGGFSLFFLSHPALQSLVLTRRLTNLNKQWIHRKRDRQTDCDGGGEKHIYIYKYISNIIYLLCLLYGIADKANSTVFVNHKDSHVCTF